MREFDLIVVGAGASGLMAASTAGARGLKALVLEANPEPGNKILLSGGGRCNVTNRKTGVENYLGANPRFCHSALVRFRPEDMLALLAEAGITLEEREHGQMFCRHSARDVLDWLLARCRKAGCEIICGVALERVELAPEQDGQPSQGGGIKPGGQLGGNSGGQSIAPRFLLGGKKDGKVFTFAGRNLLLATGGPSFPQCGGSDAGMRWAKAFGHSIIPPSPALAPLTMPPEWPLRGLEGISLEVRVELLPGNPGEQAGNPANNPAGCPPNIGPNIWPNSRADSLPDTLANTRPGNPSHPSAGGKAARKNSKKPALAPTFTLPLLFTHKGLSGPAILQISSYWRKGDALRLNFLPDKELAPLLNAAGKSLVKNFFCRLLPERLALALLPPELAERKVAELPKHDLLRLQEAFQSLIIYPSGNEGMRRAEASRGGVNTDEVSSATLESRLCPGLYFAGEVLDVCGQLGGYNLHWAWASGFVAGGLE